jgi:antitoxin component HigA of HigAB toxin-antitoxin module
VLRNTREYRAAVTEIDVLLDQDPPRGSEAFERLEFLSVLVAAYEDQHDYLEERGTPQTVIEFTLDQRGMTRADLAPLMGGRARGP